ncbi:MAG: gliding motility-associated C-terminal domain-containing protein [Lewinellaceae bacterium]|nr:gliding motility-associated C-terminal domain-containing protein [Lewinellaceae bacterium]
MENTRIRWLWMVVLTQLCIGYQAGAQLPNPLTLNTAANGTGGRFQLGANDAFWYAAEGDTMHSTTAFVPARVVGRCDPAWHTSPFPNNDWIAYDFGNGCYHAAEGCVDIFYQRIIVLPETNACGLPIADHYAIAMDFFADNCIYEVRVNGATNYLYTGNIDPYKFHGHDTAITVVLNKGWHSGNNYLIVQIKSCPTAEGFLAQANLTAVEPEYFPVTVKKNICTGEQYAGYTASGMYLDTIASSQGCDSVRMLELQVNDSYQTLESRTICKGEVYDFYGLQLSKTGSYSHTMLTRFGCDSTINLNLQVTGDQALGRDTLICRGDEYLLRSSYPHTQWYDGDFSPSKRVSRSGSYWAIMTDSVGCTFADTVAVTFGSTASVPNIFSPNDDGINDCLQPFLAVPNESAYRFNVYDRLGGLVFGTTNPLDCWDGSINGTKAIPGVYLYTLERSTEYCGKTIQSGDLTLIR